MGLIQSIMYKVSSSDDDGLVLYTELITVLAILSIHFFDY